MSKIVREKQGAFVETRCVFKTKDDNGRTRSFESGGSWLLKRCDTGLLEGILYAQPKKGTVGSWDGALQIEAEFGQVWHSAFRDFHGRPQENQLARFKYKGMQFSGILYNRQWSDIVRVRQVKR